MPVSVTAMTAMTTEAYNALVASPWTPSDVTAAGLPLHNYLQTGFLESFDAAKYCGDWEAGREHAYACAVCYTIKVPIEAMAGTVAKLESVAATLHGDRWLAEGAIVSVHLSASPMPPAWADVLAATYKTDPAGEALSPPLSPAPRSNEGPDHTTTLTLPVGVSGVDAMRYVHVVLRLADYISVPQITIVGVGTKDSAWIEGGAMLDGATLALTFDRDVAEDANCLVLPNFFSPAGTFGGTNFSGQLPLFNFSTSAGFLFVDTYPAYSQSGDASMMRQVLTARNNMSSRPWWKIGTTAIPFFVNANFSAAAGKIGCVYIRQETYDIYSMQGVTIIRGSETNGGVASGISFNTAVPNLPAGQVVRFSFYGKSGPILAKITDTATVSLFRVTSMEDITPELILGTATTFYVLQPQLATVSQINTRALAGPDFQILDLIPLGHYDITGAGIAANTILPLSSPWVLPSHAVVLVTANVIAYTDDWVPASKTSTAVAWEPDDITLHLV
jgi:hypothetical protein